jgi:CRP/FNR family transcriptional regulator
MERLKKILDQFGWEIDLRTEILSIGRSKTVKKNAVAMDSVQGVVGFPIVLDGLLKVLRLEEDREILLYYLEPSDTCAMSLTCCMNQTEAKFRAIAEQDSLLWILPTENLNDWIGRFPEFRKYILNSYQDRFNELLLTLDSVAFHKMDERLYRYLLDTKQATGSFKINKTHEQIARELGTSRVVISRLVKQLEKEDKIQQGRNQIIVL